jgi:glycosyltransferase involved in cell wall biosynthesis
MATGALMFDLSKLDVCFIAGTLGQGGAERQLFYIIKALKDNGARVRLLCLTQGEFWEKRIRDLGVEINWVGERESRALRLARMIKTLRANPPQVVQSQHFYTNLYAAISARALRVREIGAMRSNGTSEVQSNGAILGRLSLRVPKFIAANSRVAIDNAVALGIQKSRLHLLPNIVDTEQFKPAERQATDHVRLITVGRLGEEKRIDRFLAILNRLHRQSAIKVKGIIIGDGPLRPQLEHRAQQIGLLPDVVEFRGAISDMAAAYREADILVLTSDWEGTPNVLLEAMASGLPVVATRVGGVPEIVREDETGKLADAADEDSMAESLRTLIGNRELQAKMGRQAREYAVSNHSPASLRTNLSNLYEKAFL